MLDPPAGAGLVNSALPATPDGPPSDEPSAQHWEAVARRTKAVAEQWRSLHASEEARADAAQAATGRATAALQRAERDRDAALQKAELATSAMAAAKQERARWRARSDAQTASKVFLDLEACREALRARDAELLATQRALAAMQEERETGRARQKRDEAERQNTARAHLEGLMTDREEAVGESTRLEAENDFLRGELSVQLANSPPGALDAMTDRCEKLEGVIRQLEMRNVTLKRDSTRWRERARGALASERLAQLQSHLQMPAAPAALSPRGGGSALLLPSPLGASDLGGGAPAVAEAVQLRAELEFHRGEADYERGRQRAFLEALWRAPTLTQLQKQRVAELLRTSEASEADVALHPAPSPRDSPRRPATSASSSFEPLAGSLALSRPRRA